MAPLIAETAASASLLGTRIYKLNSICPPVRLNLEAEISIDLKHTIEKMKVQSDLEHAAFATLEFALDFHKDDAEVLRIFEMEMHGLYAFPAPLSSEVLQSEEFSELMIKPLYLLAVNEVRRLAVAMDIGDFYLSTEIPETVSE